MLHNSTAPKKRHAGEGPGFHPAEFLVGGWALPLWKLWVSNSWDDDITNWMEK